MVPVGDAFSFGAAGQSLPTSSPSDAMRSEWRSEPEAGNFTPRTCRASSCNARHERPKSQRSLKLGRGCRRLLGRRLLLGRHLLGRRGGRGSGLRDGLRRTGRVLNPVVRIHGGDRRTGSRNDSRLRGAGRILDANFVLNLLLLLLSLLHHLVGDCRSLRRLSLLLLQKLLVGSPLGCRLIRRRRAGPLGLARDHLLPLLRPPVSMMVTMHRSRTSGRLSIRRSVRRLGRSPSAEAQTYCND